MYKKLFEFNSRRNNVFLVQDDDGNVFIEKIFCAVGDFENELRWYDFFLEARFLPKLVSANRTNLTIIIEYVGSTNVLDQLVEFEATHDFDSATKLMRDLFLFFKKFYSFAKRKGKNACFKDVNFRNFIIGNNKIYAIDLEQVDEGDKVDDISNIIAYLISYEPKYSAFKLNLATDLLDLFLKEYSLNKQQVLENILNKLEEAFSRRNK